MARLTGPGSVPSDALFSCTFYLVMFILLYIANLISLNRLLALCRCFRRLNGGGGHSFPAVFCSAVGVREKGSRLGIALRTCRFLDFIGTDNPPVRAPTPTSPSTPTTSDAAVALTLVNANTDRDIRPLIDGTTVILAQTPRISVRANIVGTNGGSPPSVESVRFSLNGQQFKTEDNAPYAFNGNSGQDFFPFTPPVGCHTITAEAFTRDGANGSLVAKIDVNFCFVDNTKAPVTTPVTTPIATPVATPVTTPVATPVTTPVSTPVTTPVTTPVILPVATPVFPPMDFSLNPPGYQIQFFLNGQTILDAATYSAAARRWESVITLDLPPKLASQFPPRTDGCVLPLVIDDLFICFNQGPLDGLGGSIGISNIETTDINGLPVVGTVFFDEADVDDGKARDLFRNAVFSSVGFIVGVGSRWEAQAIINVAPDCDYFGPNAIREYQAISGCPSVPVERESAQACRFWDDACMQTELMTSVANAGVSPLSRITVGSLEDLGYDVNYDNADLFVTAELAPECLSPRCSFQRRRHRDLSFMDGDNSSGGHHRRLSKEGHADAVAVGRAFLDKKAKHHALYEDKFNANAHKPLDQEQPAAPIVYVGDQMVVVHYQDSDGEIYNVMVNRSPTD